MCAVMALCIWAFCLPAKAPQPASYPYHSPAFDAFVEESFKYSNAKDPHSFYAYMEQGYQKRAAQTKGDTLAGFISSGKASLARFKAPAAKSSAIIDTCARLHRAIKKTIPRFSLDRGFEFANVVKYGERQCFLQSVLIAGILQKMGVDAGVVMVYRNIEGQYTNNGHAVTLVKLPDGDDIIVDASEPIPFPKHKGLFVRMPGYHYVEPNYRPDSSRISGYRVAGLSKNVSPKAVATLDMDFLKSQFWYYRGERAPGGLYTGRKSTAGLQTAAKALETSMKLCPGNPLTVFMLSRVYKAQGDAAQARALAARAMKLYSSDGWVPSDLYSML